MLGILKCIVKTIWRNLLLGGTITKRHVERKMSTMKECINEATMMILSVVILKESLYNVNAIF